MTDLTALAVLHRRNLLAQMEANSVAIVPAAREVIRNRDVHYRFRQDSDFHYLTAFPEPDAVLVLGKRDDAPRVTLFCRERDPDMEIWNGRRAGPAGAVADYAMDAAWSLAELEQRLPDLLDCASKVYAPLASHPECRQQIDRALAQLQQGVRLGKRSPVCLQELSSLLHELRLCKDAQEQQLMRRAAEISAAAHRRAMQYSRAGIHEYELEAEIEHEFRRHGCDVAYGSIVGGGENACILHYTENNAVLNDGELVLIDAGAEYLGYDADITRTFPVNGRFSDAQAALYDLVLAAQHAAFAEVRPGQPYEAHHDAAVRVLTEGLVKLGLLKGQVDELIETGAYRSYYMHRTGHWLGMDVHDVGNYQLPDDKGRLESRPLQPGMVLTIEPGLYVSAGSDCDERWWNIGIRIEDDLLVTEEGHEVLTAAVPTDRAEIEALMQRDSN